MRPCSGITGFFNSSTTNKNVFVDLPKYQIYRLNKLHVIIIINIILIIIINISTFFLSLLMIFELYLPFYQFNVFHFIMLFVVDVN